MSGVRASADSEAAERYPPNMKAIIEEGGETPAQVFNVDETRLYWTRMPERTFFAKEENFVPGCNASKNRLTLLYGGNATGDMKLQPLLVYHSENPRAFKCYPKQHRPVK